VCRRPARATGGARSVQDFVRRVRDGGELFITPTVHKRHWGLRAAFSNWRTTQADVERSWNALQDGAPR